MKHMKKWTLLLSAVASLALFAPSSSARADDDAYEDDEEEVDETTAEESDEIEDTDPSAVVIYRDRLAPYGTWMDHPDYGTVWVPASDAVGPDFAPYVSNGRWELTADGDWLWVSGYDWGYIPFHYGRWIWVSDLGWSWIPGRRYAPAWVDWRVGPNGFIGWAPMGPSFYWVGSSWFWFGSPFSSAYVFCPTTHVFHHHVHTHVVVNRADVERAAAGTSRYGAQPTLKGHRKPASPTLEQAGVPKSAAPKGVGKHDQRALDLAGKKSQASGLGPSGAKVAADSGAGARGASPASDIRKAQSSFAAPRARQEADKQRSRRATEEAASRSAGPSPKGDGVSSTRAPSPRSSSGPSDRSVRTSDRGELDSWSSSSGSDRGARTTRTRDSVSTPPRSKETTARTRQSRGSFESRSRPSGSSAPSRSSAPKAAPSRSSSPKSSSTSRSSSGSSRSSVAPRSSGSPKASGGSRSSGGGSRSSGGGSRSSGGGSRGGRGR